MSVDLQLDLPDGTEVVAHPSDPEITLLIPRDDVADPELSIVIPALDEELTISTFIEWCHEGLAAAGIRGEILIVDSSSDRTPALALAGGARVLRCPKRGLGRAYIDATPFVRGRYVLMGDADCTYDFRELAPFVEAFHEGYEFVMGSRWKGSIERGAMPPHHQYFGTPLTTSILNVLYSSKFSDIHCGMRGMTTEALGDMQISSQSWEYASEIVLKSVQMGLRTTEVPVHFLKDQEGRVSHHRRMGWFSPFQAAWINLKAMFVYGADFFLVKPGMLLFGIGLLVNLLLARGPVQVGGVTLSLFAMLVGLVMASIGLESYYLGQLARVIYDYSGAVSTTLVERWRYTRTTLAAFGAAALGAASMVPYGIMFIDGGFDFSTEPTLQLHLAVIGLLLLIIAFETFTFTLVLHALMLPRWTRRDLSEARR